MWCASWWRPPVWLKHVELKPQAVFIGPRLTWITTQCTDNGALHASPVTDHCATDHCAAAPLLIYQKPLNNTMGAHFISQFARLYLEIGSYWIRNKQNIGPFCGFAVRRPLKLLQDALWVCQFLLFSNFSLSKSKSPFASPVGARA